MFDEPSVCYKYCSSISIYCIASSRSYAHNCSQSSHTTHCVSVAVLWQCCGGGEKVDDAPHSIPFYHILDSGDWGAFISRDIFTSHSDARKEVCVIS